MLSREAFTRCVVALVAGQEDAERRLVPPLMAPATQPPCTELLVLLGHGMLTREGGSGASPRDSSAVSLPEPCGAGRRQAFGAIKLSPCPSSGTNRPQLMPSLMGLSGNVPALHTGARAPTAVLKARQSPMLPGVPSALPAPWLRQHRAGCAEINFILLGAAS